MISRQTAIPLFIVTVCFFASAATVSADNIQVRASQSQTVRSDQSGPARGWALKFDLSGIPEGINIDAAELNIFASVCDTGTVPIGLRVSPAPELWSRIQLTDRGGLDIVDSLGCSSYISADDSGRVSFNITQLVRLWHAGQLDNAGIVITIRGNCATGIETVADRDDLGANLSVFYSR